MQATFEKQINNVTKPEKILSAEQREKLERRTKLYGEPYNKNGKVIWDSSTQGTYRREIPKPINKKQRRKLTTTA